MLWRYHCSTRMSRTKKQFRDDNAICRFMSNDKHAKAKPLLCRPLTKMIKNATVIHFVKLYGSFVVDVY